MDSLSFRYAGFWVRFVANLIDCIILMILALVLYALSLGLAALMPICFLYVVVFVGSILRATPGKAIMGLQVVSEKGHRLSYLASAIRYFVTSLFGWLFLVMFFNNKRKTLSDYVANSVVIYQTPDEANYFSIWFGAFGEMWNRAIQIFKGESQVSLEVLEKDEAQTGEATTNSTSTQSPQSPESELKHHTQVDTHNTTTLPHREKIKVELHQLYLLFLEGIISEADYEKKKAELTAQLS